MRTTTAGVVLHPADVLRRKAIPVTTIDDELRAQIGTLLTAHHAAGGLGLAAPQIGISRRFFIWHAAIGDCVLINPHLVDLDGRIRGLEGCLSIPGVSFVVPRPKAVVVEGVDQHGSTIRIVGVYGDAQLLMHELDHLDGRLVVDHAQEESRE